MTYTCYSQNFKNMVDINHPIIPFNLYEKISDNSLRVPLFGNMLFDKIQIISNNSMTEQEIQDFLVEMGNFNYSDIGLFFIPNENLEKNPIVNSIRSYVENFKQGVDPEICSENPTIFAEKRTDQGLFLCMNDDSVLFLDNIVEQHEKSMFYALGEGDDAYNQSTYTGGPIYFENREEASGEDFFSYFNRENPLTFDRLKKLGAFDPDCFFWKDEDDE